MTRSFLGCAATTSAALLVLAGSALAADPPAPVQAPNNKGVVEIETGSSSGISVRIVEDIANIIDDGATRRVLPVVAPVDWAQSGLPVPPIV